MDYKKAVEVSNLIKQIELNSEDIQILQDALDRGVVKAQLTIQSNNTTYSTNIYEEYRIQLLLQVLLKENEELLKRLDEL